MFQKHFFSCCLLSCMLLAVFGQARGGRVRNSEHPPAKLPVQKHVKLAGRASVDKAAGNPSAQPVAYHSNPEKKLLTTDERHALRRQINDSENRYPRKN